MRNFEFTSDIFNVYGIYIYVIVLPQKQNNSNNANR
jgi:hypothetical protein